MEIDFSSQPVDIVLPPAEGSVNSAEILVEPVEIAGVKVTAVRLGALEIGSTFSVKERYWRWFTRTRDYVVKSPATLIVQHNMYSMYNGVTTKPRYGVTDTLRLKEGESVVLTPYKIGDEYSGIWDIDLSPVINAESLIGKQMVTDQLLTREMAVVHYYVERRVRGL